MLRYPEINPIAFHVGPLAVHWYGLMYLVGFLGAWLLLNYRAKKLTNFTSEEISDLIFYGALGVIIGGRVGYMVFYNFSFLIHVPWSIFKIWDGGMSFHGGMVGVILAMWWYSHKLKRSIFDVTDFLAPVVPIGLGAGRIGNFINGELWGRVTDMPWGMVYLQVGAQPRHPSELYEFLLEGVLLFVILWCYSIKPKPKMAVSGLFLIMYALFRFSVEFFREPDAQLGFIFNGWMTMGQLLCVPMILLGCYLIVMSYRRRS